MHNEYVDYIPTQNLFTSSPLYLLLKNVSINSARVQNLSMAVLKATSKTKNNAKIRKSCFH